MSQFYQIHSDNPQQRLISHAVDIINRGGVVVYPTDCAYALGCQIGDNADQSSLNMAFHSIIRGFRRSFGVAELNAYKKPG